MAVVVVDEAEGVIVVFGGESEGIIGGEGVVRDCGGRDGSGDSTEGGVVVVCCDAITGLKMDEFRYVLVSIKGVEEFVTRSALGEERSRRHGFGWVPDKEVYLRVVVSKAMVFSHAKPFDSFAFDKQ